jgi:YVTN family beta-propeller protein
MAIAGAGLFTAMVVLVVTRGGEDVLSGLEGNSVGVIDAEAAEIVSQASVGTRPSAIATGGGFVWVASEADGTLSRIDPDLRFVRTLRVGESATGVSYGGGSVWVANGKERTVSQIDPDDLKFVQNFVVGNEPRAVAVGEGAVWVANAIDGTVSRIDLGSGDVEEIPVGSGPAGIAVGTGGVWVTSEASGTVTRLDPRAGTPVQPVGVGNGPTGVAVGEGAVWVANRQDGTVSRIDPATNAVSRTVDVGRNPTAVAAGFGAIWVANAGDGTISRIDASTGEPDETISVASSPNALALEDGRLWTTTLPSLSTHRGGALRIESIPLGCKCIDPAFVGDYVEFQFVYPLAYDGLVAFRRVGGIGGGAVVGNLAVGVPAPTNQGRTYSFQLRPGVLFSDGRPVRASDFRFSLERLLTVNPDLFSSYDRIVGASGCSARPPERCDLSRGIEADDETGRITIHLTEPDPDLLSKLTFPYASVVPADTPLRIVRREPIPSTGAYRIASYSKRELRLDRNPHFRVWSPDARPDGYPDEIRFHLSEDQGAQLAAVERETADFVLLYPAPVESLRGLVTRYPGRLHSDTPPITDFMFLNTRLPPFDDPRVRQAVNLATDRERVAEVLGGTLVARPTCQLLPPTIPGYQPYCPYTRGASGGGTWTSPDPGRATMLVAESGTRGMRVEVATREDRPSPGPYFVSLLRRLGYESSLRVLPAPNSPGPDPDYYEYVQDSRNQAQIGPITWFADAAPALFLDLFSCASFLPESPANGNFSQFCEPEIDAVMERAAEIQPADPVRANALWAEADHALVDQAAAVPLVNQRILGFVSERVGNYQFHPQWGPLFDQMWVK